MALFCKFYAVFIVIVLATSSYAGHYTGVKHTPVNCVYAGKAFIDGLDAVDGEDEIAVFVGDGAGGEIIVGNSVMGDTVPGHYFITIYGDDTTTTSIKDGALANDELIFKIWDKSSGSEYLVPSSSMIFEVYTGLKQPDIPPVWKNGESFGLLNLSGGISNPVKGDVNSNGIVELSDALFALKISGGVSGLTVSLDAEVDGDNKIGIPEAVYVLQYISGAR